GAILSTEDLSVYDSSFDYNMAARGGAIAVVEGRLQLSSVGFAGNRTLRFIPEEERGGAVYTFDSEVSIQDSRFQENFGYRGGAVYADASGTVVSAGIRIDNSSFLNNSGFYQGGAVVSFATPIEVYS